MAVSCTIIGRFLILTLYQSIAYYDLKINSKIASIKNRLLFMMSRMKQFTTKMGEMHPSVVIEQKRLKFILMSW